MSENSFKNQDDYFMGILSRKNRDKSWQKNNKINT